MLGEVGNEISKTRIETLTDGVFAIVMTILVLEITVPQISHSETAIELPKQLLELWPVIQSYGTSFIILGFFWIAHDYQFHYVKRANRTFLWITIFYLMFIAFVPFSTSLIGEYGDQQISVIIYAVNISIIGFWEYIRWKYATKDHQLVDSDLNRTFITKMSRRFLLGPTIYLIAVAISFVSTQLSLVMFIATPLYFLVSARKDKT
ncbi:MAG TPA: TMEM175 family protein [Nitrososphaeraceae archaeon]|nr:TMEM175 family protein [Nitrososphaeraceae archaeon]